MEVHIIINRRVREDLLGSLAWWLEAGTVGDKVQGSSHVVHGASEHRRLLLTIAVLELLVVFLLHQVALQGTISALALKMAALHVLNFKSVSEPQACLKGFLYDFKLCNVCMRFLLILLM